MAGVREPKEKKRKMDDLTCVFFKDQKADGAPCARKAAYNASNVRFASDVETAGQYRLIDVEVYDTEKSQWSPLFFRTPWMECKWGLSTFPGGKSQSFCLSFTGESGSPVKRFWDIWSGFVDLVLDNAMTHVDQWFKNPSVFKDDADFLKKSFHDPRDVKKDKNGQDYDPLLRINVPRKKGEYSCFDMLTEQDGEKKDADLVVTADSMQEVVFHPRVYTKGKEWGVTCQLLQTKRQAGTAPTAPGVPL